MFGLNAYLSAPIPQKCFGRILTCIQCTPQFLEHFFAEPDAAFFKSLGLNCIRIAISYRHFEDDLNPRVLKPDGFRHLDRAVAACAKHGIYTILDMHTAPGGQNGGWHSDAGTHIANFWIHKDFQDRLVWLWTEVARHYQDEQVRCSALHSPGPS